MALDAAEAALVRQWCAEGRLPAFASLFETSLHAATRNPPGIYTGAVWPSINTGVSPGRHGTYFNEQLRTGTYEIVEFSGSDIKHESFWEALGRAGRRIGLLDVPKAPLTAGLNGIQIANWGTHDAETPTESWPPELAGEVIGRFGPSPFQRCDFVMRGRDADRRLRDALLRRIETKTEIALDLIGREAWDLFMVGFGESHCVGHQCWHLHDPTHPRHDPALAAELGDPIRDVYTALDAAVARLLAQADPGITTIVLLSHGMGAHYDATFLLDEVLRRLEGRPAPLLRRLLDAARDQWRRLPVVFTERFGGLARWVDRSPDAAERSRRRCFVIPTNTNCGGIRLNLVGREPEGRLARGAECEAFCARLIQDLEELVDPESGRPIVKEVLRTAEVFPGEHADDLPDLLVRWNREAPIQAITSPKIGRVAGEDTSTRRTGDHRSDGFVFVRGPGITPGALASPVRAEDIAPTVAALLDVELPGVDGRPIPGAAG